MTRTIQSTHKLTFTGAAAGARSLEPRRWPPPAADAPRRPRPPRRRRRPPPSRSARRTSSPWPPAEISVGPLVSGELRAQREATVRAELGGSVLQVLPEEGPGGPRRRAAGAHRGAHRSRTPSRRRSRSCARPSRRCSGPSAKPPASRTWSRAARWPSATSRSRATPAAAARAQRRRREVAADLGAQGARATRR